jgi:Flp pilus assembly protein TadG
MRAVNNQPVDGRDEGAVLIWVALWLAVLLGVGALVIDIGRLYVERRELQNGADAAALAVAQDCSAGDCGDEGGTAKKYADLNANDAASAIETGTPCGNGPGLTPCTPAPGGIDGAAGWVRVGTSTLTSAGDDEVSFLLAPIISALTGKTVRASAAAAWGTLGAATTLPFTFSECEFNNLGELNEFGVPDGVTYVYSKSGGGQNAEPLPGCESRAPSGGTVEGGFGWLSVSGTSCSTQLAVGDTVTGPSDPGNDNLLRKSPCSESLVQNKEVLLPLFGSVTGTGANAVYTIVGFAGFIVTGYRLSGSTWPSGFSCPQVPGGTGGTGNLRCFRGEFTQIYDSQGDFGGSIDFGARVVKMVE